MRISLRSVTLLFILFAVITNMAGCSRFSRPSEVEVLKAIDDSGILKTKSFTVTSPPVVVSWGDMNKDGSWPVKVRMTLSIQMPGGKISETKASTTSFRIYKNPEGSGSPWRAELGS